VLIQRETPAQVEAIRAVITSAFTRGQHPDTPPPKVGLVDELRASDA
jgi:putative acetyltransferase